MFTDHLPGPLRTWWVRLKEFEATVGVFVFVGTSMSWVLGGTEGVVLFAALLTIAVMTLFIITLRGGPTALAAFSLWKVQSDTHDVAGRLERCENEIVEARNAVNEMSGALSGYVAEVNGARQDADRLLEARFSQDTRQVREWIRSLSVAQMEACRVILIRSLQREAPVRLENPDACDKDQLYTFVVDVNSYVHVVSQAARLGQLWESEVLAEQLQLAEKHGDLQFRGGYKDVTFSAEEFSARQQYTIACARLLTIERLLDGRRACAEKLQEQTLHALQEATRIDQARQDHERLNPS